LAVVLCAAAQALAAEPITYCGQTINGRGYLIGDLDCTGFNGHAVQITRGRLDLKGFTIHGANFCGVHCEGPCKIYGPGTITQNGLDGINVDDWVIVRGVRITDNLVTGIFARNVNAGSRVLIKDATISGNGFNGVETDKAAVIRFSSISNNGEHGLDLGVQNCESGGSAMLVNTSATGNGMHCSSEVCADLTVCGRSNPVPRLRRGSTCGKSYVRGSGIPGVSWHICSGD
jgi:hypothetical protein